VATTTVDVRVWALEKYAGKTATTYAVRWAVQGRRRKRRFPTRAAADTFRSQLLSAARTGQAFDVATGTPVSMLARAADTTSWYDFACAYVDLKWAAISPKHRKGIAEALSTATVALLTRQVDDATAKAMRSALLNWGYNARRGAPQQPHDVTRLLAAVARASRPIGDLERPDVARRVLTACATKVDGTRAAGRTTTWKRSIVATALDVAVERGLLTANPIRALSWTPPRTTQRVDRRVVVNPQQARALLAAVSTTPRSGPVLVAFFAAMYYAALRPEEAANLRLHNLDLPDHGWAWLTLDRSAAEVDRHWTDSGQRRDQRELQHRAPAATRRVPCPPQLTAILQQHLAAYGVDDHTRLFRGERGGHLAGVTYTRLWDRARQQALTPQQYASPLARRPYDLRHAAVSTWLNGGVAPSQVAEWAGHSVEVLLRVYAACLDGGETTALQRITDALDQ